MLESRMRQILVKIMKPLHAISVENTCGAGTPDINYAGGWIECKATENWPKRLSTVVRLDHDLNPAQRIWLIKRDRAGGKAFVMLHIGGEWLLFRGTHAAECIGKLTRDEMYESAMNWWPNAPTLSQIEFYLDL